MSGPEPRKALAAIQIVVLLVLGYAMLNVFSDSRDAEDGTIVITDTTGEATHSMHHRIESCSPTPLEQPRCGCSMRT